MTSAELIPTVKITKCFTVDELDEVLYWGHIETEGTIR